MKNILAISCLALLCLTACRPAAITKSPYSEGLSAMQAEDSKTAARQFQLAVIMNDHPAESSLQLGLMCENDSEMLPRAIWNFQQAAELTNDESIRRQARIHREEAEQKYLAILEENWAASDLLDRKLQIQLLKEQNKKLNDMIARITRENNTLRMMISERR